MLTLQLSASAGVSIAYNSYSFKCVEFVTLSRITWILIPALLSDAIALIKGMGKGDFRVGHARDVPTLVR